MSDKKVSFEEMLKRLEEISRDMEEGEISLDESVKLYEEAMKLILNMKEELSKARDNVSVLNTDSENEPVFTKFNEV